MDILVKKFTGQVSPDKTILTWEMEGLDAVAIDFKKADPAGGKWTRLNAYLVSDPINKTTHNTQDPYNTIYRAKGKKGHSWGPYVYFQAHHKPDRNQAFEKAVKAKK